MTTIWRIASFFYVIGAIVLDDNLVRVLCGLGACICIGFAQVLGKLHEIEARQKPTQPRAFTQYERDVLGWGKL